MIYSKILNEVWVMNHSITKNELLEIVFALGKFTSYLIGSSIDAKVRLIKWIVLLQEFDLHVTDKKEVENTLAWHLSRILVIIDFFPNNDAFLDDSSMTIRALPWYAGIVNFLASGKMPSHCMESSKARWGVNFFLGK